MRELEWEEVKQVQLGVLDAIHNFCENKGLQYFLIGGSLIGAIRHRGYIPWDDDIDLVMFRKDYEKFIESFNGHCKDFRVYTPFNDPDYKYPFAKVSDERTVYIEEAKGMMKDIGINVDIFPLDDMPNNIDVFRKLYKKILFRKKLLGIYSCVDKSGKIKVNFKRLFSIFLHPMINANKVAKDMNKLAMTFYNSESEYCMDVLWAYGECEYLPKALFGSSENREFERRMRPIPVGYDAFLKSVYGNYMELPPIEKRASHHSFKAYRNN